MNDVISRQAAIEAISSMFAPTPTQKDMVEDCLEIIENLPSAQPEQRWIPCSERLPDKTGAYLCTVQNPYRESVMYVMTCKFSKSDIESFGIWYPDDDTISDQVIAWMPLPEPWEGVGR